MILFDVGANRGDATRAGLERGYIVVALEPAPRVFAELVRTFIYDPRVIPIKMAVSDSNDAVVEFYEAEEDGLSTLNKEWLTAETMPYQGKGFRTIEAVTITLDALAEVYGTPDLIKIDVEGAEWSVFRGMTRYLGKLAFEWTDVTLAEHTAQLGYLAELGYTEFAPQFIEHHLLEPENWLPIQRAGQLPQIIAEMSEDWVLRGWQRSGLRPTADVGMLWVR